MLFVEDHPECNCFVIVYDVISASQTLHIHTPKRYSEFTPFGYENVITCADPVGVFEEIHILNPIFYSSTVLIVGMDCKNGWVNI
jgi:hypothetical protein